jgi:ribosome-associated toxin RatA of RatAB toxin-antitoxin module
VQTFETERHIKAPRAVAWAVLSDLDRWGQHAPNLSKTEVVAGEAEGAVRRCYNNAGKGWSETCTLWQPGRRYIMEVDTSDYPYPMSLMRGTFSVDDEGGGSRVKLRFDYRFKYGVLGRLMGAISRPMFGRTCKRLLDSIELEATARASLREVKPAA